MPSAIKALVGLAFSASLGLIFLVIGCALPQFNSFWPFFNLIFYLLCPLPILLGRRDAASEDETSPTKEWGYFFTTGFVVAAFGLPIVMYRTAVIQGLACLLVTMGNVFIFLTIWGFLKTFNGQDDLEW